MSDNLRAPVVSQVSYSVYWFCSPFMGAVPGGLRAATKTMFVYSVTDTPLRDLPIKP